MLDIKFIRENAELVRQGAVDKHITCDVDRLLEVDKRRRELQLEVDKLRTEGRLETFASYLCTSNPQPAPPAANAYLNAVEAAGIAEFVFGGPVNSGKAPPCDPQAPLGGLVGQSGVFPQLQPLP